ncbi:MAG: hypothetical protein Q9164_006132 [Protoblastenia rupestris]
MLAAPPFNLLDNLDKVDEAIDSNADIASEIVATTVSSFGLDFSSTDWHNTAKPSDLDKARSTIRQFYRDWSAEGQDERKASYGPVLEALDGRFPDIESRSAVKVLVPGAGLGRLLFEICKAGYTAEGNEISYHQLMASNWVLNYIQPHQQFDLHPFALDFSNVIRKEHQLKAVKIPDVHPNLEWSAEVSTGAERMSMTASDFLLYYGDEKHMGIFDAVATVFFIDTAPNVIRYIETIWNCLKVDGIWINLGPLLWHFADRAPPDPDENAKPSEKQEKPGIEAPGSFELTDEEMLMLAVKMGFRVIKHEIRDDGRGYIQNPNSMLKSTYRSSHWLAEKKAES